MGSIAFDKLKYLETLKASGISEAQARAHAEALAQAFAETSDLATRSALDGRLLTTESRVDARLRETELRFESRAREAELRLEAKIEALQTDIIKRFVTSLFA